MSAEIFMLRLEATARGGQESGHHHQEHVALRSVTLLVPTPKAA